MRIARIPERWDVLVAGVALMMCIGTVYSWSLYTRPLMALFGWSSLQVATTFAILLFSLGVGSILAGYLQDRFGPRSIGLVGILMWGGGNVLAGLGIAAFGLPWLYLCYGVIAGLGAGMAYLTPGATVTKWFPEERGLANGILLFGLGAGSIIFNSILSALPSFALAADHANVLVLSRKAATVFSDARLTDPNDLHAVTSAFVWSGVVFIVVGILAGLVVHAPPSTFTVAKAAEKLAHERSFAPREVLRTRAFYFLWCIFFVDCFAGLSLLGNAVPTYSELTGASATIATFVYGWLSILNGLGRLLWAWLSDFLGRNLSLVLIFGIQGLAMASLAYLHSQIGVSIAFGVVLITFSGVFGIMPALLADYFGTTYLGENYGLIISAVSVAGLLGPMLVGALEDVTGSPTGAFLPIAILLICAIALPMLTRKPKVGPQPQ
jgi:MFS transporter, OFA family, oxalate/formate antiporter